ncbi:basic salivary proline-rich protein 1-like [Cydia fagiglandana]|uniref:basic salivary proline-rich protein 1-like n=1 Tax=Cydia fagiglandana TaxID=1458189 RepID=UPI002FEDFB83
MMLRLSTFIALLAVTLAQSGYEYNKPNQPFGSGTTPNRPGFPGTGGSSGGYPSSPTAPSSPNGPQRDEYPSTAGGSTPGFPSGSPSYPTGPSQGFPGSSQRPGQPGQSRPQGGAGFQPTFPSGPQNVPGQPGAGPSGTGFGSDTGAYEGGDYSAIPGEPDRDYPILTEIPQTSFRCDAQAYPGYYADVEARCQVFHVCANNRTYDFLCPNGTIFSQQVFVCVWWNQFDCNSAPGLYELNANLYQESPRPGSAQQDYAPQGPSASYPGSIGPQGPSSPYPGGNTPQGPSSSYPGSNAPQGPSSSYPGGNGPQGTPSYPGSTPQRPSSSFPGTPQGSSPTYPGSSGPQGPSSSYPGSTGPSSGFPGSSSPQGPTSSYPGSQTPSGYPGSSTGNFQGYPSGAPTGPSFPTGGNTGRPQGPSNDNYPQPPNREYLPPRN